MDAFNGTVMKKKGQYVGMTTKVNNKLIMSWVWLDQHCTFSLRLPEASDKGIQQLKFDGKKLGMATTTKKEKQRE